MAPPSGIEAHLLPVYWLGRGRRPSVEAGRRSGLIGKMTASSSVPSGSRTRHRYRVTPTGFRTAVFLLEVHTRILRPGLADLTADHLQTSRLRAAFAAIGEVR
jgi:hypothetical protein